MNRIFATFVFGGLALIFSREACRPRYPLLILTITWLARVSTCLERSVLSLAAGGSWRREA